MQEREQLESVHPRVESIAKDPSSWRGGTAAGCAYHAPDPVQIALAAASEVGGVTRHWRGLESRWPGGELRRRPHWMQIGMQFWV